MAAMALQDVSDGYHLGQVRYGCCSPYDTHLSRVRTSRVPEATPPPATLRMKVIPPPPVPGPSRVTAVRWKEDSILARTPSRDEIKVRAVIENRHPHPHATIRKSSHGCCCYPSAIAQQHAKSPLFPHPRRGFKTLPCVSTVCTLTFFVLTAASGGEVVRHEQGGAAEPAAVDSNLRGHGGVVSQGIPSATWTRVDAHFFCPDCCNGGHHLAEKAELPTIPGEEY